MALISNSVKQILDNVNTQQSDLISIQVKVWRSANKELVLQKGSGELAHFLGSYEGPLPSNEELEELFKEGNPSQKIQDNVPILYGSYEKEVFPIIKGSTISFFSNWESYEFINSLFTKHKTNVLSFRVKVPQINPVLKGYTRGDARKIFGVRLEGIDFTTLDETDIDKWDIHSTSLPLFLGEFKNHPWIIYQMECVEASRLAAALSSSPSPSLVIRTDDIPQFDIVKAAL